MKNLLLITLLLGSIYTFSSCQPSSKTDKPLNVIVIMADDLGYETIAANGGSSYQTPNIDRIASEGIRFEHAYAQPLCTPSRVKLMTGIYNVRNYVYFGLLDTTQTTFGHLFQDAGYRTCIVGKWQLGKDPMSPRQAGFDEHCLWQVTKGRVDDTGRDTRFSAPVLEVNGVLKTYGRDAYGPDVVSEYGMDFMERSVAENKPFLLYYPMILTHCPFSPTPGSPEWIEDDTTVLKYKGKAHYFEDMMAHTDKIIGSIDQKLEALGIKENTLLIFTGDNGTDVPVVSYLGDREVAGAKGKSIDAGTRVPFIARWPKVIPAAQVTDALTDLSDVLPTICEAAYISVPGSLDIDGKSMLAHMKGEQSEPREWIYNWYARSGKDDKKRVFARTKRYKLYTTGEFYEVPKDYLEEGPLSVSELSEEVKATHDMLKTVLDSYAQRRLENISNPKLRAAVEE